MVIWLTPLPQLTTWFMYGPYVYVYQVDLLWGVAVFFSENRDVSDEDLLTSFKNFQEIDGFGIQWFCLAQT